MADEVLDRIGPGHVCEHGVRWPHLCHPCDNAAWAKQLRYRRWSTLAEDGAIFGLTPKESTELAALEAEFGPTELPQEMRS